MAKTRNRIAVQCAVVLHMQRAAFPCRPTFPAARPTLCRSPLSAWQWGPAKLVSNAIVSAFALDIIKQKYLTQPVSTRLRSDTLSSLLDTPMSGLSKDKSSSFIIAFEETVRYHRLLQQIRLVRPRISFAFSRSVYQL